MAGNRRMRDAPRFEGMPLILPAIDLRGGRVVRLVRGDREAEIDYGGHPLIAARRWIGEGAECLHIIDLGGAFGEPDSLAVILEIARSVDAPVETGGGIRGEDQVARLLEGGVARVILGTRALKDPPFLRAMVERHGPERIVLAMDTAANRVKISGWTEDGSLTLEEGIEFAAGSGVRHLLLTAIDRDGTLSGPALPQIRAALELAGDRSLLAVAAGGIGSIEDIRQVLELGGPALEGVVVGRALYEGTVSLGEAVALAKEFRRRKKRMINRRDAESAETDAEEEFKRN